MIQFPDEDIPRETLIGFPCSAVVNSYRMWSPGCIYSSAFLKWDASSMISLAAQLCITHLWKCRTCITWRKLSPRNGNNLLTLQHCYSILWQYVQSVNKFEEVGKVFLCHLHISYCTFSVVSVSWGEGLAFCDAAGFYHQKCARFY